MENINSGKKINIELVLYFLAGLILGYVGLIAAIIWISFKSKVNNRAKYISLIIGFVGYLIYIFLVTPLIIQPNIEKAIFAKKPEMLLVRTAVEKMYPDAKVGIYLNTQVNSQNSDNEDNITTLSVSLSSRNEYSIENVLDAGKLSCETLESGGYNHDKIAVSFTKIILPFNLPFFYQTFSLVGSCEEWENNFNLEAFKTPIKFETPIPLE